MSAVLVGLLLYLAQRISPFLLVGSRKLSLISESYCGGGATTKAPRQLCALLFHPDAVHSHGASTDTVRNLFEIFYSRKKIPHTFRTTSLCKEERLGSPGSSSGLNIICKRKIIFSSCTTEKKLQETEHVEVGKKIMAPWNSYIGA